MIKKAVVISNFFEDLPNSRPKLASKYFDERSDFDMHVIYPDFSHSNKEKRNFDGLNYHRIETIGYKTNFSILRIISHVVFSIKALFFLKKMKADLVFVSVPPNFLGYLITRYSKRNNIKTIIDIIDVWPEALPMPNLVKKILNFTVGQPWRFLRDLTINNSDYLITESNYFFQLMHLTQENKAKIIYLKKSQENELVDFNNFTSEDLTLCYLGNIGRINDIDSFVEIALSVSKKRKVFIKIIGDGDKKDYLLEKLNLYGINYTYYGKIFEEFKKYELLKDAWFGFNGYRDITEVALSYKSIDYWSYGIPIINSAKGDTSLFLQENNIGFNFHENDLSFVINSLALISLTEVKLMKENSYNFFKENFSYSSYVKDFDEIMLNLYK